MKYAYEINDENGQFIACGECDNHTAETAIELIYNEIIEPESTVIEILQDKQEYKCWSYDATVTHVDSTETVTITIK